MPTKTAQSVDPPNSIIAERCNDNIMTYHPSVPECRPGGSWFQKSTISLKKSWSGYLRSNTSKTA